MISLKDILKTFSDFLESSWEYLSVLSKEDNTGSLAADWIQANWEILVESLVDEGVTLDSYGDGADCNGSSSRVLYPDRLPTHQIICVPSNDGHVRDILNDQELMSSQNIIFDRFVTIGDDGWYYDLPPFDKVLACYDGDYVVISFNNIDFQLKKIT